MAEPARAPAFLPPLAISPQGLDSLKLLQASGRPKATVNADGLADALSIARVIRGVAVVPISGPLFRGGGFLDLLAFFFGGTSYSALWGALEESLADPECKAILLRVNSPGGEVDGLGELADFIYTSRAIKPIWTYYEAGASAAVWLGSQAEHCVAYRGAEVGCIGVIAAMVDTSKADDKAGITEYQIVSSRAPAKRSRPVDEEVLGRIQSRVDDQEELFFQALARGRGTAVDKVVADFGAGDLLIGDKALAAGLVDALGDFNSTLEALATAAASPISPPRAARTTTTGATHMATKLTAGDPPPFKKDDEDEEKKGKKAEHDEPDGDEAASEDDDKSAEKDDDKKDKAELATRLGLSAGASTRDMLRAVQARFDSREDTAALKAEIAQLKKLEAARAEREITARAEVFVDAAIHAARQTAEKRDVLVEAYVEGEQKKAGGGQLAAERLLFPAGTFGKAGALSELTRGGHPVGQGRGEAGRDPAPGGVTRGSGVRGGDGPLAGVPVRGAALDAKAKELMKADPKLTYSEAQDRAFAEDPTLY